LTRLFRGTGYAKYTYPVPRACRDENEWEISFFSPEKRKYNIKYKNQNRILRNVKEKHYFPGENKTAYFGGTVTKAKFPFPGNVKFLFLGFLHGQPSLPLTS
jgi:hypothetical protein